MRIYANCVEAITDIGRELKKCGTVVHTQTYQNKDISQDSNFETKELEAFQFCIINTDDKDEMPNIHLPWLKDEFYERVYNGPINPGKAYLHRPEVWEQFLVGRHFDYTYSERLWWQLDAVRDELIKHPETRQAIVEIHNNHEDLYSLGGKKRIPCSMFYQFLKRDGKLDIIYVMRSSDFSTHFQNDIWLADELRRMFAESLEIPIGKFIMVVSSLHIYRKDWGLLSNY